MRTEEEWQKLETEIKIIMKNSKYDALGEFINAILLDIEKLGRNGVINKYNISPEDVEKISSNYSLKIDQPISSDVLNNIKSLAKEASEQEKEKISVLESFGYNEKDLDTVEKIDEALNNLEMDSEYDKYSKLYQEKFGRKPFIANPGGSKEQTISVIKVCLEKNEDLLGEILNPNVEGNLY